MEQRQFRSDDSSVWADRYGSGSDGALTISSNTTDTTPNTTCSGTSGTTGLAVGSATGFANGNLLLIHQTYGTGAGNWELNKIASGGTTTSWTLAYTLCNTYGTGAQVYLLKQYRNITIDSGVTLTAKAWNGSTGGILALLSQNPPTLNGSISLDGTGFRGGNAASSGGNQWGHQGEGETGNNQGTSNTNQGEGAGAPGNKNGYSAGGSGGGYGTSGSQGNGDDTLGTGGATNGNAGLTTMLFGGGGSSGSTNNIDTTSGKGAAGGGICLLIAPTLDFTSAESVTSNGADGSNSGTASGGGGGGGGGGSWLLKAETIVLGDLVVFAIGGVGGKAQDSSYSYRQGGGGGNGRIHADYGTSISGTTNPTIDTRQDFSLINQGGAFFLAM